MRAVVTGCRLASEDVLPARNRPKKPSLLFFLSHCPPTPWPSGILPVWGIWARHWSKLNPKSWALFLHWACSAHEHAQKHAPVPSLTTVLRWLEGTWGRHVQICWADTTCQDVWA